MAVLCVRNASGHNYRNIPLIVDLAMRQIPRSTERISSYYYYYYWWSSSSSSSTSSLLLSCYHHWARASSSATVEFWKSSAKTRHWTWRQRTEWKKNNCILRGYCKTVKMAFARNVLKGFGWWLYCTQFVRGYKVLSYRRETVLHGALVLAKSGRLELGDNILRAL